MSNLLTRLSPKWVFPPPVDIPLALKAGLPASDFMLEALARRGIQAPESARAFLDHRLYAPADPGAFSDMSKAVSRIMAAIRHGETIGIWGDFDVDGQTSTALLVETLRGLGACVRYHIPIRSRESHGIKLPALREFLTPDVKLIITCDTGITAHDAASELKSLGVDLIITDHHSLPEILPEALAVINPHMLPPGHPLETLAGVGVAYTLADALFIESNRRDLSGSLHDLVALGCIADMASLTADTRYLVQSGLERLRTAPRPFLSQMASTLDLPLDHLNEEHIGFYIAPRMNAVGRLEDANPMVELLTSRDVAVIKPILDRMEALNASRRVLVSQVFEGALTQLEANPSLLDQPLIMLSHPEWPAGVVGIAAGRLAEMTHRPVILMSGGKDGLLRGSARSVEGIDITSALTANQAFLSSFGGHPMAAGLSLAVENLPEFRARLQQTISQQAAISAVEPELQLEAVLPLEQVTLDLLGDLERLSPFGVGNPAPVFSAPNLTFDDAISMGKNSEHRRAAVSDLQGNSFEILWWQGADLPVPEGQFDLAYTAHMNLYKGTPKIQYEWVDFRPVQEPVIHLSKKTLKSIKYMDQREVSELKPALLEELSATGSTIWAEGLKFAPPGALDRLHLEKNRSLIILTIPPSSEILLACIARVKPAEITFMGLLPQSRSLSELLPSIGRLLKEVTTRGDGQFSLASAAASYATTPELLKTVLQWYAANGSITFEPIDSDRFQIRTAGIADPAAQVILESRLKKQDAEIAAFRRYYLNASLATLAGQRAN